MPDHPAGIAHLHSRTFLLPQEDIDTDQIIPARFLTTTTREGLGQLAFHDWRYDPDGTARADCALNTLDTAEFAILVAGRNFGCGSSREHAPWALHDFGVRAVISSEIADIFKSNAAKNTIVPILAPPQAHAWLLEHEGVEVKIDLERQYVDLGNGPGFHFEIEPFARHCLIEGTDPLGFLLSHQDAITAYEARSA